MSRLRKRSCVESNRYLQLTIVSRNYRRITDMLLSALTSYTSFHLCSLQLHSSASRPIMFVADNEWLHTRKRKRPNQIVKLSVVFQALSFHWSSKYKVGLHFLTQWRHSSIFLFWVRSGVRSVSCTLVLNCAGHFGTNAKIWDTLAPNT